MATPPFFIRLICLAMLANWLAAWSQESDTAAKPDSLQDSQFRIYTNGVRPLPDTSAKPYSLRDALLLCRFYRELAEEETSLYRAYATKAKEDTSFLEEKYKVRAKQLFLVAMSVQAVEPYAFEDRDIQELWWHSQVPFPGFLTLSPAAGTFLDSAYCDSFNRTNQSKYVKHKQKLKEIFDKNWQRDLVYARARHPNANEDSLLHMIFQTGLQFISYDPELDDSEER